MTSQVRGCAGVQRRPGERESKTYLNMLFDRNIIDCRGMMCSVPTPATSGDLGMGDVGYGGVYDIFFPPELLRL